MNLPKTFFPAEARLRRSQLFLIAILILFLLAFWTISDPLRLDGSLTLNAGDYAGAAFCHRITSRSFTIAGRPMPLCARCSGMYIGFMVYFLMTLLAGRERWTAFPKLPIMGLFVLFVAIMGFDGVNSYSHFFVNTPKLYTPNNYLRLFTGLGTGLAIGAFIIPTVGQVLWREQVWRAAIQSWWEFAQLILVTILVAMLLLTNIHIFTHTLAIFSVLGVLFILGSINTVMLLLITGRDGKAETIWQALWPLVLGFCLAVVEAGFLVYVRILLVGTITGIPGLG